MHRGWGGEVERALRGGDSFLCLVREDGTEDEGQTVFGDSGGVFGGVDVCGVNVFGDVSVFGGVDVFSVVVVGGADFS